MNDTLYKWPNPTQNTDQPEKYVGGDRLAYLEKRDKAFKELELWIHARAAEEMSAPVWDDLARGREKAFFEAIEKIKQL